MKSKEWQTIGLFAALVGAVAFWSAPTAQKVVVVVGLVALIANSGRVAGLVKRVVGR